MREGRPLILGYHGVGSIEPRLDPIRLYVSGKTLIRHVESLQRRGYEFLSMRAMADLLGDDGAPPPPNTVVLTFDDGTTDHATVLPGLLERLGVPATVYVCPGLSGTQYPWTLPDAEIRFMEESEMKELARNPLVEIGAHTNEHTELHEADEETALAEMAGCKRTLEELLDVEVVSFCYPRCHYSPAAAKAAPSAGFSSAVTCGLRGSWNRYELNREVAHGSDGRLVESLRLRGRFAGLGSSFPARAFRHSVLRADRLLPTGGSDARPARPEGPPR